MVESPKSAKQMESATITTMMILAAALLLLAFAGLLFSIMLLHNMLMDIRSSLDKRTEDDRKVVGRLAAIEAAMATRDDVHAVKMKVREVESTMATREDIHAVENKIRVIESTTATREDTRVLEKRH